MSTSSASAPAKSFTLAKNVRWKRKLRQYDVAKQVGISAGYLSRLENRRGKLTRPVALRLAKVLRCTAKALLADAQAAG